MKLLYKTMLISLLCLLTKSLMAQDQIIGKRPDQIDIIGDDEDEPIFNLPPLTCYCFYSSSYLAFQNDLNAQSNEQIWLLREEAAMKNELENRFNKDFTSFRDAQKALFSKMAQRIKAPLYYELVSDYIDQNFDYSSTDITKAETIYKTIDTWKDEYKRIRDGNPRVHYFGDLMYNNIKIENFRNTLNVSSAVVLEQSRFNQELNKKVTKLNWIKKLEKARETKAFQNWIAERYLDYYYSLDYKDAIKAMAIYMVSDWIGQSSGPVLPPSSFFPNQVYWSSDHHYYNQMISVTNSQSITSAVATGANLSADEAIFRYAINSMGTQNKNFIGRYGDVRGATKGYLKYQKYRTVALSNVESAVNAYVNNWFSHSYESRQFFSGTANNLPNDFGVDLAYKFTYTVNGETNGFRVLSNFYHYLYNVDTAHYAVEGFRIRLALVHSGSNIDFNGVSDEDLGRLLNYSTMYPFGNFNFNFFLEYSIEIKDVLEAHNISFENLIRNAPLLSLFGDISEAYQANKIDYTTLSNILNYLENEDLSTETILFVENAINVLTVDPNANPLLGADCRSFEYAQPPGALQKGCAVTNFDHRFYTAGIRSNGSPYYGDITIDIDRIYFTMPTFLRNGQAANLTAVAVTNAIKATDVYFFENPDITEFQLNDIFKDEMRKQLAIYGGSFSLTVEPFPIPSPAPYITSILGISNPFDCD